MGESFLAALLRQARARFSCSSPLDAGWANTRSLPGYYGAGSWAMRRFCTKALRVFWAQSSLIRDICAFTLRANASIFRASLQWPIRTYALVIENGLVSFFPMYKGSLHVGSTDYYDNICYMGSSSNSGDRLVELREGVGNINADTEWWTTLPQPASAIGSNGPGPVIWG